MGPDSLVTTEAQPLGHLGLYVGIFVCVLMCLCVYVCPSLIIEIFFFDKITKNYKLLFCVSSTIDKSLGTNNLLLFIV